VVKTPVGKQTPPLYVSARRIPTCRGIEPADWPSTPPTGPLWASTAIRECCALAGLARPPLEQIEKLEHASDRGWHPRGHLPRDGDLPPVDTAEQLEQPGPWPSARVAEPRLHQISSRQQPTTIPPALKTGTRPIVCGGCAPCAQAEPPADSAVTVIGSRHSVRGLQLGPGPCRMLSRDPAQIAFVRSRPGQPFAGPLLRTQHAPSLYLSWRSRPGGLPIRPRVEPLLLHQSKITHREGELLAEPHRCVLGEVGG